MDFKIGIVISATICLVTGQPPPQGCTSLTETSHPCGCALTDDTFDVVCGSDGLSYLSMCFLKCQEALSNVTISMEHYGICKQGNRCSCRAVFDPVCGSDGVTYPNECTLACITIKDSSIRLKHMGDCHTNAVLHMAPEKKEDIKNPMCCCYADSGRLRTRFGNNGKRYVRSCRRCTSINPLPIQQRGSPGCSDQSSACPPKATQQQGNQNKCTCMMVYHPVCGNNMKSYVNFCVLYCSSMRDRSVQFQNWGICGYPLHHNH